MISGIGTRSALGVQSLVDMRRQLDDLQRQLGTGKKSETHAGVGLDRGLLMGLRNRVSSLEGYESTIGNVDVRMGMVLVLGGVGNLWGVVVGSGLIGEAETILAFLYNNVIGKLLVFIFIVLAIRVWPRGLFGYHERR